MTALLTLITYERNLIKITVAAILSGNYYMQGYMLNAPCILPVIFMLIKIFLEKNYVLFSPFL